MISEKKEAIIEKLIKLRDIPNPEYEGVFGEREENHVFNLNDAYLGIGGFGRFQWIALISLALLRNFGL